MYEQSAKNLIHWIIVDRSNDRLSASERLNKYLAADDWELDVDSTYNLRVVINNEASLKVFYTEKERQKYIDLFKLTYGSIDDGDANWIDMEFDGSVGYLSKTVKRGL